MGQVSTLDGVDCGFVHLQEGVQVAVQDTVTLRAVATISRAASPRLGQELVHDVDPTHANSVGAATTWELDELHSDNGVNRAYILRRVT